MKNIHFLIFFLFHSYSYSTRLRVNRTNLQTQSQLLASNTLKLSNALRLAEKKEQLFAKQNEAKMVKKYEPGQSLQVWEASHVKHEQASDDKQNQSEQNQDNTNSNINQNETMDSWTQISQEFPRTISGQKYSGSTAANRDDDNTPDGSVETDTDSAVSISYPSEVQLQLDKLAAGQIGATLNAVQANKDFETRRERNGPDIGFKPGALNQCQHLCCGSRHLPRYKHFGEWGNVTCEPLYEKTTLEMIALTSYRYFCLGHPRGPPKDYEYPCWVESCPLNKMIKPRTGCDICDYVNGEYYDLHGKCHAQCAEGGSNHNKEHKTCVVKGEPAGKNEEVFYTPAQAPKAMETALVLSDISKHMSPYINKSPLIASGGGTALVHTSCQFPFLHEGELQYACVKGGKDRSPNPWCYTSSLSSKKEDKSANAKWGECSCNGSHCMCPIFIDGKTGDCVDQCSSDEFAKNGVCVHCSQCPRGMVTKTLCNGSQDTVCESCDVECGDLGCLLPGGKMIGQHCKNCFNVQHNGECMKNCPKGYLSDTGKRNGKCVQGSKCPLNMYIVKDASAGAVTKVGDDGKTIEMFESKDTECKQCTACPVGKYWKSGCMQDFTVDGHKDRECVNCDAQCSSKGCTAAGVENCIK